MLQGLSGPHNGFEGHTIYSGHRPKYSCGCPIQRQKERILYDLMKKQVPLRVKNSRDCDYDLLL